MVISRLFSIGRAQHLQSKPKTQKKGRMKEKLLMNSYMKYTRSLLMKTSFGRAGRTANGIVLAR